VTVDVIVVRVWAPKDKLVVRHVSTMFTVNVTVWLAVSCYGLAFADKVKLLDVPLFEAVFVRTLI